MSGAMDPATFDRINRGRNEAIARRAAEREAAIAAWPEVEVVLARIVSPSDRQKRLNQPAFP
jgi:hypothetical protein